MVDDKQSRDEKADDEERRPPEREREEVRNRVEEDKPKQGNHNSQLGDLDEVLEAQNYPTATDELVEAYGDYVIQTQRGEETLEEVLASTDNQMYDSADDVRRRLLGLVHR
ncbi:hypothetical protein ACFFQF_16440 [Haladaptatus pallidirubidus]|nr:hypothetical protein [Haladaptatus pallidirubidus]